MQGERMGLSSELCRDVTLASHFAVVGYLGIGPSIANIGAKL